MSLNRLGKFSMYQGTVFTWENKQTPNCESENVEGQTIQWRKETGQKDTCTMIH